MGSQIAAHFANAGVPVAPPRRDRRCRGAGTEAGANAQARPVLPARQLEARHHRLFDEGLPRLGEADWIIEGVVEQLDVKRALLERVDAARRHGHASSARTPRAFPSALLAEGRSDDFRRHWLGTHFFNPPRYLRLLEMIPTPDTDPAVLAGVARVRRPPSRQGRGGREGLAELHRQPPRALRRDARAGAGGGRRRTRSRRSTRSPARRSAGRRAPRSARSTSPASTSSAHVVRNLTERLDGPGRPAQTFVLPPFVERCSRAA